MAQVFISYSRMDKEFVQKLADGLVAWKREVWLDETNIEPTAEWLKEIFSNIEASDNFLFVISPDSVVSTYARKEIDHASLNNKRIVPIFYQPVADKDIPEAVAKFQRIDFTGRDSFDAKLVKLIATLDTDLDWKQDHTRLLTRAKEWEREGRDTSFLLRGRDLREAERWVATSAEKEPKPTTLHSQYILASRSSATKRQRIIIAAVISGLFVATGLAMYAFREEQRAVQQEKVAVQETAEAKRQEQIAKDNEAKTRYGRILNAWQSAARESLRDGVDHVDDDRTALLVRQALLLHKLTDNEPKYLVEEALQQLLKATAFGHVLSGHEAEVLGVAFSPNGRRLASCGWDRTVRVWNIEHPQAAPVIFYGRAADICSAVAFSPDGKRLASSSWASSVHVWNLEQPNTPPLTLAGHSLMLSVAFASDGKHIAAGAGDNTVLIWDLRQPTTPLSILSGHQGPVYSVAFAPQGEYLASGSADKTVRLWNLRQISASPLILSGSQRAITTVAFAPDGSRLATGSEDKILRVWDLRERNAVPLILSGHEGSVKSVSFSPDGIHLASSSEDKTAKVWDLSQPNSAPMVLSGPQGVINSVAFAPDGKRLATANQDKTVRVWDLHPNATPLILFDTDRFQGEVVSVAFSQDERLASASLDRTIRVWNLRSPNAPSLILPADPVFVTSVAFAPDGNHLAADGLKNMVRIWDLRQPKAPRFILQNHQSVRSLAFAPDGTRLASAGVDDAVRVWNLQQPGAPPVVLLGHRGSVNSLAFAPDGSLLATASLLYYKYIY